MAKKHDIFISHASPDKESFVRPFAEAHADLGLPAAPTTPTGPLP
ncbi:hypothetical protein ACVI3U_004649 [Sinorhizobium medicae]